jgi:hypothetical protein
MRYSRTDAERRTSGQPNTHAITCASHEGGGMLVKNGGPFLVKTDTESIHHLGMVKSATSAALLPEFRADNRAKARAEAYSATAGSTPSGPERLVPARDTNGRP